MSLAKDHEFNVRWLRAARRVLKSDGTLWAKAVWRAVELFAYEQAEAVRQEAADFRQGFPDVISTIEDLIAEGG
jgi:hypothetical protein